MALSSDENLSSFCTKLPKLELHAHLNGSLRKSTMLELSKKRALSNSSFEQKFASIISKLENTASDLDDCFVLFPLIHELITEHDILYRITLEMIEDYWNENTIYLEIRTTPKSFHNSTKQEYTQTVLKAIHDAEKLFPSITVMLVLSINRADTKQNALETVQLAVEFNKQGEPVVGIDFSGNPKVGNFDDFHDSLLLAKQNGLDLVIHVGEVPNSEEETKKMLSLNPRRIGHAVFLSEAVGEYLKNHPVPIEICLTSNIKTKSVDSFINHHFKQFYDAKFPMALCTDDRGIFTTSMTQEYEIAATTFGLSNQELLELSKRSVDYLCGTSEQLTQKLLKCFEKIV